MSTSPRLRPALAVALAAAVVWCACDRPEPRLRRPDWRFASTTAPYALELAPHWEPFDAGILGNGADFAARHDDQLLMVIPIEDEPLPDGSRVSLEEFADAGLEQLREGVPEFELLEREPLELHQASAIMALARGRVHEHPSRYVITYTRHDGWRYQIVAWGHASSAADLAREVDAALQSWRFTQAPATSSEEVAGGADAGRARKRD